MIKRIITAACALTLALSAFAQQGKPQPDLEQRVRELEQRVAEMQKSNASPEVAELRREIDILTREIEQLKNGEKPAALADTRQYGLGAAASKVYRSDAGVSIGGYGEFLYQNFSGTRVSTADALRAILYTGYKFNDRVLFNSEVEYEHANTERSGEVEVEFAYLDYLVRPSLNVRAGMILMPVGLLNEQHEPTAFFGARRTQVETRIIPTTWSELGAGVFGDVGPVTYRAYLTTALTSDAFTATGIRSGRQMASQAKAADLAAVGRVDWKPVEGVVVGASLYGGNSGQDRSYDGRVSIAELHVDTKFRGVALRGLLARGSIGDAAAINAANKLTGASSVGDSFGGWYAEGGYDLPIFANRDRSLTPYVRYEKLDTQRSVPAGFARAGANNQSFLTLGAAFKPIQQTVVKADWQRVRNAAGTGVNQWNLSLGYIF